MQKKYILEGLQLAEKNRLVYETSQAFEQLAIIHAGQSNYKSAYDFTKNYQALKDSLLNEKIVDQALKIDAFTDYEKVQSEQQIQLLSAQNELKDLKLSQTNRNLFILLLGLLGLSFFAFQIYRSRKKVELLNRRLQDNQRVIEKAL